jgi:hypothetical protein
VSVHAASVVIIVFAMPGCPACHDYLPRLRRRINAIQGQGYPIYEYRPGRTAKRGELPVLIVDSTSTDPSVVDLADKYQISALPTTIILPRYGFSSRWEGSLPDDEMQRMIESAALVNT